MRNSVCLFAAIEIFENKPVISMASCLYLRHGRTRRRPFNFNNILIEGVFYLEGGQNELKM